MTVLIVDDERPMRELLARWLQPEGYEVLQAESAEAAMTLLASRSIAAALCDRSMPGHDGIWLVEQIRAQWPAVAVILATADDAVPPRVSLQAGVVGYLVKPFKQSLVLDAVRDAVAWHRAAAAAPKRAPRGDDAIDQFMRRAGRPESKDNE
jgi:two-component system response regulator GlrR